MHNYTTLGIDICDMQIGLALVRQTDKGAELLKSESIRMLDSLLSDGNVKNPHLLAKIVKEFCSTNKIPTQNTVISLPVRPSIFRIMELPKNLPANPGQFIRNELKYYAVLSGKTIVHDFCSLFPQKNSGASRLLLAAGDEERITELVKAFNRVGINIKAVEPAAIACIRMLHETHITKKFDSCVLIVTVQDKTATLCVFNNSKLDFVHTLEIGKAILEQAEGQQALLAQMQMVRQFYDVEIEASPKKWDVIIVVPEEKPNYENLSEILQKELVNANVQISSPATTTQDTPLTRKIQTNNASPVSIGLAMRYLKTNSDGLKINLLPTGADKFHNIQKFALMTAGVAIIVFLLSFASVPVIEAKFGSTKNVIAKYKQYQPFENAQEILAETTILDQKHKLLINKIITLKAIAASAEADWPKILNDIGRRTPQEVRITYMIAKNADINLRGQALSYEQLNLFIKQLGNSPYISSTKLIRSQIDPSMKGMLSYDISCRLLMYKGTVDVN